MDGEAGTAQEAQPWRRLGGGRTDHDHRGRVALKAHGAIKEQLVGRDGCSCEDWSADSLPTETL